MRSARTALVIALVGLSAGCVAPARTEPSYRAKAADTASAVVSAARTVLVAVRAASDGHSFPATVAVTIADAETDAASARDAFVSIQPPDPRSDELRRALLPPVQRAVDLIEQVRIAARRAEETRLDDVAAPLGPLAVRLDGFATRYG